MGSNPYQAPQTTVADVASHGGTELATRSSRLTAIFLDGLILAAIWVPILFGTGYWQKAMANALSTGSLLLYFVGGFALFVLVQGWPLAQSAQTWGKKLLGIRIVHLDGSQPTLATLLLKRYLPIQVVSAIPLIGWIASLVDALFIFRDDRRCVHDLIAGTQVIKD